MDITKPEQVATVEGLISHPRDFYMDMHTSDFPNGLVRDQIVGTDLVRLRVTMAPPGDTSATPASSAPTLLLLRTYRAADGTVLAGSIMWICNFRFPATRTDFTGLDIHEGAAGVTGSSATGAPVTVKDPVSTTTGFGNIFFFTTIDDPAGEAAMNGIVQNPERWYMDLHTGANATSTVRAQLGPAMTAVPAITGGGNSADGGPSAPGGMISIFGTNLAKVISDPYDSRTIYTPGLTGWFGATLPTSYNGTKVTIGGKNAPLMYVAPDQINAQVPLDVAAGPQPVIVTNSNGAGPASNFTINAPAAPAIFADAAAGGRGIVAHQDFSLVTPQSPAKAGEALIIYATGLGSTTPAQATGTIVLYPPQSDTAAANVTIGGQEAGVIYSLASPYTAGLYQVAVTMPSGIPAGTAPVLLRIGSAASAPVNIAVQ
jgi:uncharacterized protein (TIGR03437 family)